jgi:hypothetical protein
MTDRYIIDDAGTLIDIETRNTYDYVSEICPVLNRYDAILKTKNETIKFHVDGYNKVIQTIKEAYQNERTSLGKSVLKQLIKQME